jgi:hypothetical protein
MYYQCEDKFYQQNESMAIGNSISGDQQHTVDKITLDTLTIKPLNGSDMSTIMFIVWPQGQVRLQKFIHPLNSLWSTIKFKMEVKANNTLTCFGCLDREEESQTGHESVYYIPTHIRVAIYTSSTTIHIIP